VVLDAQGMSFEDAFIYRTRETTLGATAEGRR